MTLDATKDLLLALLRREETKGASAVETDPFVASLVRLQPDGHKRPFFFVHPASGTVGVFFEVARAVDPLRPFFAFQPPGVDGEREPIFHLRTLAAGYVRQMRKVQPAGPYAVGGWSVGGLIAFEMAHQLRAAGEEVALLVLCDTVNHEIYASLPSTREELASSVHQQMAMMVAHLAKQRGAEVDMNAVNARIEAVKRGTLRARANLIFDLLWEAGVFAAVDTRLFEVFRKVYRANLVAAARYDLPEAPLDATITLMRCKNEESLLELAAVNPTYGWAPKTTRPVEIVGMPSHHYALFHGDMVPITARTLRSLLDAAERR